MSEIALNPQESNANDIKKEIWSRRFQKFKTLIGKIFVGTAIAAILTSQGSESHSGKTIKQLRTEGGVPAETTPSEDLSPPDEAIDVQYFCDKYKLSPNEVLKLLEIVQEMDLKDWADLTASGYYSEAKGDLEIESIGAFLEMMGTKLTSEMGLKKGEHHELAGVVSGDNKGDVKFLGEGDLDGILIRKGDILSFAFVDNGAAMAVLKMFEREGIGPFAGAKKYGPEIKTRFTSGDKVADGDFLKKIPFDSNLPREESIFSNYTPDSTEKSLNLGQTDSGK